MINFLLRIIYITIIIFVVIGITKFYIPFQENDYKIKSFPIKKTMIGIDTKKDYTNYLKNYK